MQRRVELQAPCLRTKYNEHRSLPADLQAIKDRLTAHKPTFSDDYLQEGMQWPRERKFQ